MIINTVLFGSGLTGAVKIPVSIPRQNGTLTYNSAEQSPVWMNYDESVIDISGNIEEINAGEYTSTFSLKDVENYVWEDGSDDSKPVNWSIGRAVVSQNPTQSSTLYYTGSPISANFNYNENEVTPVNVTSKTNVGTYYTDFVPTDNYQWSNGSIAEKSFPWTISRAIISTVPSQSGTLTYSGYSQTPTWDNYNSNQLTISVSSQINAGTYTATFTPTSNYQWSGGSISAKAVSWKINMASQTISVNTTYIKLTSDHQSETIYVTGVQNGLLTTSMSGDPDAVVITVNGSYSVTVTALKDKDIDYVRIYSPQGNNYLNSNYVNVYVDIDLSTGGGGNVGSSLNETSWDSIKELSDNGTFANYFSVGDTKEITLNGNLGNELNFNNFKVNAFVIGINHNQAIEEPNTVHFQIGKIGNKLISLVDSVYGSTGYDTTDFLDICLRINSHSGNAGGWYGSDMRYEIMGNPLVGQPNTMMSVIPSDLKSVLKQVIKYTDNTGANWGQQINVNVTASSEIFTLPSEYEIFGKTEWSNMYEASYQAQYEYYYSGNSKKFYKHNNTNEFANTWLRSPTIAQPNVGPETGGFCIVDAKWNAYQEPTSYNDASYYSNGIFPIFFV